MKSRSPNNRLHYFFAGMSEHVFQTRLGIADPPLVDYITNMLMRFVRLDHPQRVLHRRGSELHDLSHMLWEAEQHTTDQDRRSMHRLIGDMALFWTGIFPESLEPTPATGHPGKFNDYCSQGKRAYLVASQLQARKTEDPPGDVLQRIAEQFELCAAGLHAIRQEWKHSQEADPLDSEGLL